MLEHQSQQTIPASHPCLAGHFPGNPVVPAVVLLECVGDALSKALGRRVHITAVPAVKFLEPLLPERAFTIVLQVEPDQAMARFQLTAQGTALAQGRLEYAMAQEPPPPAWKSQPERGTRFMLKFILWLARRAGRRVTRWTLVPTTAYFLLSARAATRASRQYLARIHNQPPTLWQVARHIHSFASVVLDRVMLMIGGVGDIVFEEHRAVEERRATYATRRGSLLFVSHLGSFEALRVVGGDRAPIKVVLDREHGRALTALLGELKPDLAASIIDASQPGPALALTVRQALDDGYRVGVMVDRARAGEKTVSVPFLGSPAPFPAGPWLLASALQARVLLAFCLFRGGNRYEAHFELFSEKLVIARERRAAELAAAVRQYAVRLEHFARLAPYNWFNFYDFWNDSAQR